MSSSSRKLVTRTPHAATKPTSCRRRALRGDGQLVNRLFHGPLGNEHFELGVGRNLGASVIFCSKITPQNYGFPGMGWIARCCGFNVAAKKQTFQARSRSKHSLLAPIVASASPPVGPPNPRFGACFQPGPLLAFGCGSRCVERTIADLPNLC